MAMNRLWSPFGVNAMSAGVSGVTSYIQKVADAGTWIGSIGLMAYCSDTTAAGKTLTFPRGAAMGSKWYANFDANQGAIGVRWTPTWAGSDGKDHYIIQWSANGYLKKGADSNLTLSVASGVTLSVSAAAWLANAQKVIVVRWDADNPIDGSNNHLCITVADSHTYGYTADYTPEDVDATIYVGTDSSGKGAGNGSMQMMAISREVWWDGAAGIDTHHGEDIVAYPCWTDRSSGTAATKTGIGSWGIVCGLSGDNSTATATMTPAAYTGYAFSHPYASNQLGGTGGVNGYMLDGTYTNDQLAAVASPTVAALAEGEKIFGGGYKVTGTSSDYVEWALTGLTVGADYVLRAIANGDGTAQPRLQVYDTTNSAVIAVLDGTVGSTRQQPNTLLYSFELPTNARGAAADCTAIKVQLRNAVADSGAICWHQVELLANAFDNPSFETGAAADPWIPYGWANSSLTSGESAKVAGRSGYAIEFNAPVTNHHGIRDTVGSIAAPGSFWAMGIWMKAADAATFDLYLRDSGWHYATSYPTQMEIRTTAGLAADWKHKVRVARTYGSGPTVQFNPSLFPGQDAAQDSYGDDAYAIKLNGVTLTVT